MVLSGTHSKYRNFRPEFRHYRHIKLLSHKNFTMLYLKYVMMQIFRVHGTSVIEVPQLVRLKNLVIFVDIRWPQVSELQGGFVYQLKMGSTEHVNACRTRRAVNPKLFSRVVCACWIGVVAYDLYQRMFLSAYVHIHMSATNVRARFAVLSLF